MPGKIGSLSDTVIGDADNFLAGSAAAIDVDVRYGTGYLAGSTIFRVTEIMISYLQFGIERQAGHLRRIDAAQDIDGVVRVVGPQSEHRHAPPNGTGTLRRAVDDHRLAVGVLDAPGIRIERDAESDLGFPYRPFGSEAPVHVGINGFRFRERDSVALFGNEYRNALHADFPPGDVVVDTDAAVGNGFIRLGTGAVRLVQLLGPCDYLSRQRRIPDSRIVRIRRVNSS